MRKIIIENKEIIQDSGVFFGRGVFETILIKENIEFLDFHLERLNKGLLTIGLKKVDENLEEIIKELNIKNKVLKIIVTEENIIFKTRDIPYTKKHYEEGFSLKLSNVLRNSTSRLNKVKTLNYLENLLEKENANKEGFNDVLFINEKGNICETATGNLFFVKNGKIYTPKVEEGLLNGTIREFLIKEFKVDFKNLKLKDLEFIDEIFMTNSIIGIMKIKKVDKYIFTKEDTTKNVVKKYSEKVRRLEEENE